jgi:hypothetical protein
MSESPSRSPESAKTERRQRNDRRADPGESRRGARAPKSWERTAKIVLRDAAMVLGTLAAIIVGVKVTNPIYTNQPTVVASLEKRAPIVKAVLDTMAPVTDTARAQIVSTPEFEADRKAFAADLVATGHMDPSRADTVSYYAVREAYLRGIPPAVVFGVMLTENSRFVSKALSNVGAVGLMQVYPKVWLKALASKFGHDLESDSTNLKYGVYILSTYIKNDQGKVAAAEVNKGLLHYNGCVRGTNTPNCRTYPGKVATYVAKQGNSICGDKGFYECIAKPFLAGFTGRRDASP